MRDHDCDHKGLPTLVVDQSGDEPITGIYPACSKCGKPQVFTDDAPVENVELGRLLEWQIS